MKRLLLVLTILFKLSLSRDFYVGMFKKNDLLVAQDTLYKEKNHFGFTVAKYGRIFNCPITYVRVSDRLGVGRPPTVRMNRGGLQKRYLTLILTSSYNTPIAVNIYVGCENKMTTTLKTTKAAVTVAKVEKTTVAEESTVGGDAVPEEAVDDETTPTPEEVEDDNPSETTVAEEDTTVVADTADATDAADATEADATGADTGEATTAVDPAAEAPTS